MSLFPNLAEIAQQDNITGDFATGQQQLSSVRSPAEVEDAAGSELSQLMGEMATLPGIVSPGFSTMSTGAPPSMGTRLILQRGFSISG